MARPEKTQAVQEITERFNETDAVLLTEYRGLRVAEIREVRNALREADTDYKVLKNTLARIAVREVGLEDLVALLEGPTAIAFVKGDVATAAKAIDEAIKKFPVLSVKGGVLNGKILDADQARALARLESREVLLSKIAMLMNSPAQQTVNAFAALLRDLGSMLAQVVAKKESGELPGGQGEPETPAAATAELETPAPPPGDATLEQPEVEEAERAEEAAAADESTTAGDETEPEGAAPEEPAAQAAEEAEPPAETAEAVDQVPAAPESEAAQTQETEVSDKSEKEE